jgi:hypothetical protein
MMNPSRVGALKARRFIQAFDEQALAVPLDRPQWVVRPADRDSPRMMLRCSLGQQPL